MTADGTPAPSARRAGRGTRRWDVLPHLMTQAPPRVLLVVGALLAWLGFLIVTRPLTSLLLLGVYVGASAILSGILELPQVYRTRRWWTGAFAIGWIALGVVVLVWIGRSLDLLPQALSVLLLLGGVSSLADAATRRVRAERPAPTQRLLTVVWGASQVAFGILSLTWPDVTVLVVAVVFGLRTLVYGVILFSRGVRGQLRRTGRWRPRWRMPRWLPGASRVTLAMLLVVVTAVGWTLNGYLKDGAPVVDAFYTPPATLPAGHGTLIRVGDYAGQQPPGATARRILYTTTDTHGAPIAASGLVIVPHVANPAPMPVVLWNHGTTGVARGCAPSLREASATRWAIPGLDDALRRGWIVVAPDYAGQGAPGVFPYLIGQGEARSALDAVLAAQQLPHLWVSHEVVVWGHSQGGHAALFEGQVARRYTPSLTVQGVAALAPAADPLSLARDLTAGFASVQLTVLTAWVLVPYSETYADVRIDDYVAPGARAIVREMALRCPSSPDVMVSVLAALGVSEDRPLYIGDLTGGALGLRLGQNAAAGRWPQPLLILWGSADEVIPRSEQSAFVKRLCRSGDDVRWAEYPDVAHQQIIQPGSPALSPLIAWTQDRFRHVPSAGPECS